jgi:ATPase family associated with various cellular activities (AAA)
MEYRYPGVYIEEIPGGARPISGVSRPVPIKRLLAPRDCGVLRALAARMAIGGLGTRLLLFGGNRRARVSAAGALARKLHLKLYGETEKNLGRFFDAAQDSGSVLLLDEPDALFGKRSDVKDVHDRYANMERGHLLHRLDGFRGLVILATKRPESIDRTFLSRCRKPKEGLKP